ncbi:hypothetical protein SAMN05446589_1401 [Streptomyces sp. OV198]|nr:hypothetical protein SAMN05446589_1401 [Streptomyces sp. OV198]
MVFAAFLLPPGLLCLVLVLGRYEEWLSGGLRPRNRRRGMPGPGAICPSFRARAPRCSQAAACLGIGGLPARNNRVLRHRLRALSTASAARESTIRRRA